MGFRSSGPDQAPQGAASLEDYLVANFWRLYTHFFKTYNEKVWAVPASEISADWGAQRIKGMSLWTPCGSPVRAAPRRAPAG